MKQHPLAVLLIVWIVLSNAAVAMAANSLFGGTEFYRPSIEPRSFLVESDGVWSPADARIGLPSGEGTIEFWVRPGWRASGGGAREQIYCVLAGAEAPAGSAVGSAPAFDPRYAVYMNDKQVGLQIGNTLCVQELSKPSQTEIEQQDYLYVVLQLDDRGAVFYINGRRDASFTGFKLRAKSAKNPPTQLPAASLLVGGRPNGASLGKVRYVAYADRDTTEGFSLANALVPFEGEIGGVRIWSRLFPIEHFLGEHPPLTQRGPAEVRRSTAFPDTKGDGKQPNYGDLIAYSDFSSSEPSAHRVALQWPVSGLWVNQTLFETRPVAEDSPGQDDSNGKVQDFPVYAVLPTAQPDVFAVYQDESAIGALYHEAGKPEDQWTFTSNPDLASDLVDVELLSDDRLSISFPRLSNDFGGNQGDVTGRVVLRRPNLDWKGGLINPNTGFFTSGFMQMTRVCYKAFDVRKMSFFYAYQGETGSAMEVFAEPGGLQFNLSRNAGGKVIPFGFSFIPIGISHSKGESRICSSKDEVQYNMTSSFGSGFEIMGWGRDSEVKKVMGGTTESKKTSATLMSSAYNKDFMLTVDKTQARLSPAFLQAIQKLRAAHDRGETALRKECEEFVSVWGTHYSIATTFGGMLNYSREMDEFELMTIAEGSKEKTNREHLKVSVNLSETYSSMPEGIGASITLGLAAESGYHKDVSFGNSWKTTKSSQNQNQAGVAWSIPSGHQLSADASEHGPTLSYGESGSVPIFFDLRTLDRLLAPAYFSDPVILGDVRMALRNQLYRVLQRTRDFSEGANGPDWAVDGQKAVPRVWFTVREITGLPVDLVGTLHVMCIAKRGKAVPVGETQPDDARDERLRDWWDVYDGPAHGMRRELLVPIEAETLWTDHSCAPSMRDGKVVFANLLAPSRAPLEVEESEVWDWLNRASRRPRRYQSADSLIYEHFPGDSIGIELNFQPENLAGQKVNVDEGHAAYFVHLPYTRGRGRVTFERPRFNFKLPPSEDTVSVVLPLTLNATEETLTSRCKDSVGWANGWDRNLETIGAFINAQYVHAQVKITIAYDDGKVIRRPQWKPAQVKALEAAIKHRADSISTAVQASYELAAKILETGVVRSSKPNKSEADTSGAARVRPRPNGERGATGVRQRSATHLVNIDSLRVTRIARRDSLNRVRSVSPDSTRKRRGG